MDIGDGHRVGAAGDSVRLVVHKSKLIHLSTVNGIEECIDGTIAGAGNFKFVFFIAQGSGEVYHSDLALGVFHEGVAQQLIGGGGIDIVGLKQIVPLRITSTAFLASSTIVPIATYY